ncbi:MAG: 4Fe-4S dicluster domain-containing protein [Phycisphaerae bacterium]|nr:4Fe-4S dicluster domain-containing protein [Phycisphaerae bacterium]
MVTELIDAAAVAVIDDEESMREGCRQTLDAEGYRTAVAEDGERGVRLVERTRPNVVLVDLKMPGMDGMEVIDRIRRIDPDITTIVITGYGTVDSAVAAMKAGARDFLSKPFGTEKLLEAVAHGFERHRLQKQTGALDREKQEALDNFAAVVCHQLRSPAAAAAQYVDVVSAGQTGPLTDRQKSMLQKAYRRLEDLTSLIGDWVKLAQVEAGTLELGPEPVELAQVIEDAWGAVGDDEARARVTFKLQTSEEVRPVRGQQGLLGELFRNLFTNSVRFTSGPGEVTVRLSAAGRSTVVRISDTGIGIPYEELPHLFEPFYQGARAGVRRRGGCGLGLAVAERIVSAHGGTITASSDPGEGATFTLTLPVATDVSAAPAPPALVEPQGRAIVEVATKVLSKAEFLSFVEKLIRRQAVIGVRTKETAEDRFVFGPLNSASQLRLDYDVTLLPPKKYLIPPREVLVDFTLGSSPTARPHIDEPEPAVLIGVHPYDMIAINQLDRLMLETNGDPNYLARREALTIIGIDPVRASERAFWAAMGCDVVESGFDLWLTDIGGAYVAQVGSVKGASLLDSCAEASDATEKQLRARSEVREKLKGMGAADKVCFRPAQLPGLLRNSFEHEIWAEQAAKCLSCGACNLVCPTCYCFDVKDEVDLSGKTVQRYRVWDGCVLEDFAKVAGDENFRHQRLQRYRHRFYRKGMYLYDKYGHIACVGCGRCAAACLPDIADPITVYNTLKQEKEHDSVQARVESQSLHT